MTRPFAFTHVRLVDPESGYDGPGGVIIRDGVITDVFRGAPPALSPDIQVIDGLGQMLCPGLIDLRVKTGEPGSETKETLKSASRAAAAGGVTSIVVQPDTLPAIDEPVKVWNAIAITTTGKQAEPGTVIGASPEGLDIATAQGVLRLTELQRAGGKRQTAAAFIQGWAGASKV